MYISDIFFKRKCEGPREEPAMWRCAYPRELVISLSLETVASPALFGYSNSFLPGKEKKQNKHTWCQDR